MCTYSQLKQQQQTNLCTIFFYLVIAKPLQEPEEPPI